MIMQLRDNIRHAAWMLILPFIFLLYSNTFEGFSAVTQEHNVVAEADSAYYTLLIQDFHLSHRYGDEYNTVNRGFGDRAQKHKIHHILYAMTAGVIYKALAPVYRSLGLSDNQVLFAINALLSCLNIVLLHVLLRRFKIDTARSILLLVFYSFSLSTWIYGSVPESWTLSATLVLLFLILHFTETIHPFVLALFIGISMLNNIFLISLYLFLFIALFLRYAESKTAFIAYSALSLFIIVGAWASLMFGLSLFDESLSPRNYINYTLWFRGFMSDPHPFYELTTWKMIVSNLYINSVLSNQPDPRVPPAALLTTLKGGTMGLVSTITYASIMLVLAVKAIGRYKRECAAAKRRAADILKKEEVQLLAYCLLWALLTLNIYAAGGILYSTVMVPAMVLLVGKILDPERKYQTALLAVAVFTVVVNNIDQIMIFRKALQESL